MFTRENKRYISRVLLGKKLSELIYAKRKLGYKPDIKTPKTFNEKILYRKLYGSKPEFTELADKYKVRAFVYQRLGQGFLPDLYHVGENAKDIPFAKLPDSFAAKTNHGSGCTVIVEKKDNADFEAIKEKLNKSMKERFGFVTNEPWYQKIEPKIIIEQLWNDKEQGIPFDYKFFCFNGKCHYIQVDLDRFTKHARNIYDTQWILQDFTLQYKNGSPLKRPKCLEEMINVAETLAKGFDFVRVDLYQVNEEVKFGEMTFSPGAGLEVFKPDMYDKILGDLWDLELKEDNPPAKNKIIKNS